MNRKATQQQNDTRLNGKRIQKHGKPLKILQRCPTQEQPLLNPKCENKVQKLNVVSAPGIILLRRGQDPPLQNSKCKHDLKESLQDRYSTKQDSRLVQVTPCILSKSYNAEQPNWWAKLQIMEDGQKLAELLQRMNSFQGKDLITKWDEFYEYHRSIQQIFKKYLRLYLNFCSENLVDNFFWKSLIYNVRAQLRNIKSKDAMQCLHLLITQSVVFYESLLEDVYKRNTLEIIGTSLRKSATLSIAHRLMIRLGDLNRYLSNQLHNNDLSMAEQYYKQALRLLPTNGSPYNQLAVIYTQTRKTFDAIYFYMRCLQTSHPIQSARECLLDLFDDAIKQVERTTKVNCKMQQLESSDQHDSLRTVVWISPEDVIQTVKTQSIEKIPNEELPNEVTMSYLYLSGKLYMGVGMESFYEHLTIFRDKMVSALENKLIFADSKLFRMFITNISLLEHNKQPGRRELRYHTFNFSNTLLGVVLQETNKLLATQSTVDNSGDDDTKYLSMAMQCIHVHLLWMMNNGDIWEPVRQDQHCVINTWKGLNTFFDAIHALKENHPNSLHISTTYLANEENIMDGFEPLRKFKVEKSDKSKNDSILTLITEFQRFYKEKKHSLWNSNDYLNLDREDLLEIINELELTTKGNSESDTNENVDIKNIGDGQSKEIYLSQLIKSMKLLRLKQELDAKNEIREMCNRKFQEILSNVDDKVHIEVRPRYLLPDTNCFIDYLEELQRLAKDSRYILQVPLTVIKELDGLSKGVKLNGSVIATKRIHHFDEVSSIAEAALNFINSSKEYVQCKTSKQHSNTF